MSILSYIVRYDSGSAPNPFGGICTLTICKPVIRRTAKIGDWIVGTGSKVSRMSDGNQYDLSDSIVYAMKVTRIMSFKEYDIHCLKELPIKIPDWEGSDWTRKIGDCIYSYNAEIPKLRKSVHTLDLMETDLSGLNSVLSNEFYYFGSEPRILPHDLKSLIKIGPGHKREDSLAKIQLFERWITQFVKCKIYADPLLSYEFKNLEDDECISRCAKRDKEEGQHDKSCTV